MSDTSDMDGLKRFVDMSNDELLGELGRAIRSSALECLNQALTTHGGTRIVVDGQVHAMDRYIDADKLHDVLTNARRLAEERSITVPQTINIESVRTDSDAIRFIQGA